MGRFAVNPLKEAELLKRMEAVGLREEEIEERFIRGSGPGGQHRNKTSTCVYLRHMPTGTEVRSAENRSQSVNRFLARRLLVERIEIARGITPPRQSRAEKQKKQKKRRHRRARGKALEGVDVESLLK